LDINYYKNLLEEMRKVNERDKNFNSKFAKNYIAIKKMVEEYERDIQPEPEFIEYLNRLEKAPAELKVVIKQNSKNIINRYKDKLRKVSVKYSNYPIELEEFKLSELPNNISTRAMRILYELNLIVEE